MQFPILNTIAKNRTSLLLTVIFSGIACGFLIVFLFLKLKSTYATFYLAAIIFPFVVIISGDTKRLLWAVLIICLPVTVDITINPIDHIGGPSGYIISIYDMVLAVLYLFWFVELIQKKKINIRFYLEISLPAIFLIGFACLSIIPAKHPNLCVYEIIEVLKMYLTFIYLANNIKTKNDAQFIIIIFIASLLFEGLLGFAQHRYSEPFFPTSLGGPHRIYNRVSGTWISYNDFAWYLTFFLPIAFSILFSEIKILFKLLSVIALLFGFGALIWTGSRAGWISCGASILFVIPFVLSKIKEKMGLIKTFAAVMAAVILISPLIPRLSTKLYGRFTGDDRGSADSRWPQYEIALNIIKENPIIGIGINNYIQVMRDYDTTEEGIDSITQYAVHNIFLHIAAEMGILGIATFFWFIAVIFIKGLKYIITNEGFNVYAVIGMIAGILAFLVHGLVDTGSLGSKLYIFVWFFAGIIFAIIKIKPQERHVLEHRE